MTFSNKELVGASTGVLILGVLRRGSSYGYDIVRQVNEQARGAFTWQEGTVYPVLHKLEREGLIRSRWQESESGRRWKDSGLRASGLSGFDEGAGQWKIFYQMVSRIAGVSHA